MSYLYQCTSFFWGWGGVGGGGQRTDSIYIDTLLDYSVYIVQKCTGPILIVLVNFLSRQAFALAAIFLLLL
jgi:hypothetical protein